MSIPDRTTFENIYAGQAPWDIGRPQKALIDVADQITGSILDAGCGTGDNAPFFASRGSKVTGIELAFAKDWKIESIQPSRFETRPDMPELEFSEGGPKAWFVVVERA
jgi:SAM-dependent methyltransferase